MIKIICVRTACVGCYEQCLQLGMMTSQYHYILSDLVISIAVMNSAFSLI